jgi:hypothetical protein
MTLAASAIPHFAASVRYFMAKGVTRIRVSPRITPDPEWRHETREGLREQVDHVIDASVDLWRAERLCPVSFLDRPPMLPLARSRGYAVCGVASGHSICVDWEGQCWPCVALARSITSLALPHGSVSRAFALGHLEDKQMPRRLAELRAAAQRIPAFAAKERMRSAYSRCRDCENFGECLICPAAVLHSQASGARHRVPDPLCAFNQVVLEARRKFHDRLVLEADAGTDRWGAPSLQQIGALLRGAVRVGRHLTSAD